MAKEIERKYLLKNENWKPLVQKKIIIKQGYLNSNPERIVRVRISNDKGMLTIKSKNIGITRQEFEYAIPFDEATELIKLCEKPIIEKVRNIVHLDTQVWEIDEFGGENEGLVLAEIELESETTKVSIPSWIGEEVSSDAKYYNSNLIKHPFKRFCK